VGSKTSRYGPIDPAEIARSNLDYWRWGTSTPAPSRKTGKDNLGLSRLPRGAGI
jgi:hypothetical protein